MGSQSVLVLGGTGTVGSSLLTDLAGRGVQAAAATRDPSKLRRVAGVRAVRFDYTDASTFPSALEGVERVFVMLPSGHTVADRLLGPFLETALVRVKRVVTMTAAGVDMDEGIPLRKVERIVERSGVDWTHIRPSWFMQNFHTFWMGSIRTMGSIALPAADARTAFIDARDIAACAAAALVEEGHAGKAYTLTGPEALTYGEAAAILMRETGRRIAYQPVDDETFRGALLMAGLPADYAGFLVTLFGSVRAGFAARVTPDVQRILGRPGRTLTDYARDHKTLFAAG